MARQPYRPMEAEPLRPVASPVDTFVRAQEPSRDTNLQDLARSLSGLGGSLAGMVGKRDAQAEEDDKIRGEAAFWQSKGAGAAEAVAQGLIPAQASPAYMRAYKRLEGEVAGGQLEQKFSAAYDTWEGKASTDPKAYDAFVGGFIKDNITTQDPDVLRGLLPKVHQVATNFLQRHIGDASKATQSGFTTALSARGEQAIDDANTAGLASKKGTDYAGVFGSLEAIRAEGLKVGANREQVDNKLIDTVTTAAITKRDPKLLEFLDRKVPGQDYTWGNTPYGRDARQKTIDTLETMGRKSIADDEKKNREEKTALKDDVTRRTIQAITKAPNDPIPEVLLAAGEKVDPDFRVNAITWRDKIGKGTQTSDPEDMLAITTDIINGGGLQRVQRGIRERVFKNPEDLTRAYKLAEGMKAEGPKLDEMLRVGTAKTIIDTLKKQTATEKNAEKIMFDDGSMSREGLQSTSDYKQALMEWLIENPRANSLEREKAAQEIGAKFLDRLSQPGGPVAQTFYDRQGLGSSNTFGSQSPPKVDPTAPEPASAAKPPAPRPGPVFADPSIKVPSGLPGLEEDAPAPKPAPPEGPVKLKSTYDGAAAWYKSLPAETKAAMKTVAEKQGITERHMSQILHQRALDAGLLTSDTDPTPVQRPATPAPATPGKQSSMMAPDGTLIETASLAAASDPTADTAAGFQRVVDGAYSGRATFDGTAATMNGRTFATPVTADQVARQFEGLSESDPKHREALTAFLSKAAGQRIDPAKVPWCAAFVDAVLDASGKPKRGSLRAADFLDYGATTDAPSRGDVVVFKSMARGSSGHVGFVIGIEGDRVHYIAGNDDNKVQEDTLPMSKVAGFRRPPEAGTGPFVGGGGQGAPASSGAFTRALSSTASPTGSYASPELQAEPKAARILDLVGAAELNPANAANYNAFSGNAAADEDLSRRTLDQTISWSRDRGTTSSATGRYQFLADTMDGLKKEMGLSGREPFSPALQDRMALALLERRGYRQWAAGKLSTDDFANALAKEWASLPNLTTGRSHYAGDGLNKSLVSPEQVRAALTGTGAFPAARLASAAKAVATSPGGLVQRVKTMFGAGGTDTRTASDAYANAPDAATRTRLRAANPDPVTNSDGILGSLQPNLTAAIRKAQADNPALRIVVAAKRGEGAEVWPVDAKGRVTFDPAQQDAVGAAIRRSATQLGFGVNIGGGPDRRRGHVELVPLTRT